MKKNQEKVFTITKTTKGVVVLVPGVININYIWIQNKILSIMLINADRA